MLTGEEKEKFNFTSDSLLFSCILIRMLLAAVYRTLVKVKSNVEYFCF